MHQKYIVHEEKKVNKTNKKPFKYEKIKMKIGDAGDRTLYLSHAKRALYHLSYIPLFVSIKQDIINFKWIKEIIIRSR